jgi:hypothetical protein
MRITKHRIHNLDRYLAGIEKRAKFRVLVTLAEKGPKQLARAGFGERPQPGDTILPRVIGPVSRFNAKGGWAVHRHLPKEPRYVRTVRWRWSQWSGRGQTEEHEDFRDIYRDCYPREEIPPLAIELTYAEHGGEKLILAPELVNEPGCAELNKNVINLLLELFAECEVVGADLRRMTPPAVRKINWRILPPGQYPWSRLREHIDSALGRHSEDTKSVIWDRQKTLKSYEPAEIFVGEGGFDDYLAYLFPARRIVVLESVRKDNAIYVFGLDWRRVSQLTKADILNNRFHRARIVHIKGWKAQLAKLMARSV